MAKNKIVYGDEVLIDLTQDTVEAGTMLTGATAHDRSGAVITGTCTFDADTSDATAAASNILNGKSAYVNGAKVDGTMANNGSLKYTLTSTDRNGSTWKKSIPVGFHDGSGYVQFSDADLVAGNIKQGVDIGGVVGSYSGEAVNLQAKSATPSRVEQKITADAGYDALSQVTVAAIPYQEQPNSAGGITVTIG